MLPSKSPRTRNRPDDTRSTKAFPEITLLWLMLGVLAGIATWAAGTLIELKSF